MNRFLATFSATLICFVLFLGCDNSADTGGVYAMSHERAASARSDFTGMQAPDFTLPDSQGNPVSLSGQRGKWVVLYFYPKDDTPGCTCQATDFTRLLFQFETMNAELYGVSEDSPASHRRFIEKHNLRVPLLSDPDHSTMRRYGAWVDTPQGGRVIRSTFIVGPEGTIRYHFPEVIPEGHAERVRQILYELQQEQQTRRM